jgi:hypothetical protein
MEKEFKHPGELDRKGSGEGSSSSSESAAQASDSRTDDAERTRLTRRKRIRAYQKIDYWQ